MNEPEEMNLFVALKVAEYYPDKIAIMAVKDFETDLWAGALWAYEKGIIGDPLFCTEDYVHKTQDEAIVFIENLLKVKMNAIKILSN